MNSKTHTPSAGIKPVLRRIWSIAFVVIAALALIVPVVAHFGYGIGFSTVLSQSMQPTFSAGDIEITRLIPASTVAVGDIVLLNSPEGTGKYSHRVIKVASSSGNITLTTRGDANPAVDRDPVVLSTPVQVSEVITTVPLAGFVVQFFTSSSSLWLGPSLLTLAVLLLLARLFVRKSAKHHLKEIAL